MIRMPNYFAIARNNIRRWVTNPRIYILVALLIIFLWEYEEPILHFSSVVEYRVSPWLFPFLSSSAYTQMFMMFGVILLLCDAPFLHEGQPYVLIRTGRTHWVLGQILYISLSAAIYFLFIAFMSVLLLVPNLFISADWGKVLRTLAQTDAGQQFHVKLSIADTIQSLYTPIQAFILSWLFAWCVAMILGLIIFIINIYLNRAIGAIVAAAVVLLDFAITNNFSHYMYRFSPISMARLTIVDPSGLSLRPTLAYTYIFYVCAIVILSFLAILSIHKREIQVSPHL